MTYRGGRYAIIEMAWPDFDGHFRRRRLEATPFNCEEALTLRESLMAEEIF
jgi:hypothetical protein